MKGEYLDDQQKNQNPNNSRDNMFAKLHHQHHHHHQTQAQLQAQQQSFHHQPAQPQPTYLHLPFHVATAAAGRECQTSEEADSHQSRSPTATAAAKKETHDGASIEVVRRPRGRPPGSKNKQKPPVIITRDSEPSMSPYVLEVSSGVDIIESVVRFCRKRGVGLCILSGSGTVANVTLRQPTTATPGSTVTFHGRFDILSISATVLQQDAASSSGAAAANGVFTISLAGHQGQVFGGAVVGPLASGGTVYLIAATFSSPSYQRLPIEEAGRNGSSDGGGGNSSPPGGRGGGESGHPPAPVESSGGEMGFYSCHLPSDVIWAPTARQPPPPPPPY